MKIITKNERNRYGRGGPPQIIIVRSHQSDSSGIHWNRPYSSGIRNPLDFSCSPQQNKITVDSGFHWNPLNSVSPSEKKRAKNKTQIHSIYPVVHRSISKTRQFDISQAYYKGTIALPRVSLSISFPRLNLTLLSVILPTAACI
jgi:hypothetical protein